MLWFAMSSCKVSQVTFQLLVTTFHFILGSGCQSVSEQFKSKFGIPRAICYSPTERCAVMAHPRRKVSR